LLSSALWGLAGCPNQPAETDVAAPDPTPTVLTDAPLVLSASIDYRTGEQRVGERTTPQPVTFTIPSSIYVRTGNAGNGQATFQYRAGTGVATCLYRGGATVSHPTTDLERARGERYQFVGCDNGQLAEQPVTSTWAALKLVSGDSDDPSGMTSTELHMGGGCSEPLRAPLSSEEVVLLRAGFSWDTMPKLPETDVEGHPALFHTLVYVESKEQTAALDRMRIYWSAQPISERYMSSLRGKCGRVEHATDGRGVVVYALFPAKVFNIMRDFGIQAMRASVAPPFKLIIPSPPEQSEYVNTDGSIKYSALASSGFAAWLASRPSQQPWDWNPTHWPGDISDAAKDAYDWTKDNVVAPVVDTGEAAWAYASKGFDAAIDFATNAADDLWEQTQQILGDILRLALDKVHLNLKVTMVNRDPAFPAGTAMTRLWGPSNADGTRPNIVPAGAHVRVRQWGLGFLPVMDQNQLGENGEVSLTAIKGADGREGDLCVEMDTDYARITSDFIPNEVCDFAVNTFGNFDRDWDFRRPGDQAANLVISQADLFAFTQIKDSADYYTKVIGASPYQFEVLTGPIANRMTRTIAGSYRAMTLCLDFPGTGASLITSAAQTLAAAGYLAGPVVGGIASALAFIGSSLIEKDLWWPDAASEHEARDSRGVMTHEYGHFAMCSLLYAQGGPGGLTGLLGRVFEGQNDSRDDEIALMTEGWADTFTMQVVGASNYIQAPLATSGGEGVNFCTASPCMDQNFVGSGDYVSDPTWKEAPFHDELARFESLFQDAFDRADSTQRFSFSPANGDVFQHPMGSSLLEIGPAGYLANPDENVSLSGGAWKTWVRHWLERGRPAVKANVIGGLVQTMKDEHHTWCDICELLALHDQKTDPAAFDADPTGRNMTFDQRYSRWTTCSWSPDIKTWLGAPPAVNLSLDAHCRPCPLHNFVDSNGVCQPCPAGSVASGNKCSACEYGASSINEMCIIG